MMLVFLWAVTALLLFRGFESEPHTLLRKVYFVSSLIPALLSGLLWI